MKRNVISSYLLFFFCVIRPQRTEAEFHISENSVQIATEPVNCVCLPDHACNKIFWKQYVNFGALTVPQRLPGYEGRRSKGLRIYLYHLGFFNEYWHRPAHRRSCILPQPKRGCCGRERIRDIGISSWMAKPLKQHGSWKQFMKFMLCFRQNTAAMARIEPATLGSETKPNGKITKSVRRVEAAWRIPVLWWVQLSSVLDCVKILHPF